jgi:hypothetical protein
MSIKAEIIVQESVAEQAKDLLAQKENLTVQVDVLERKLEHIKASIAENDEFKRKNQELLAAVLAQFQEEWNRKQTHFPDIRLEVLTASASLNAPPKKA